MSCAERQLDIKARVHQKMYNASLVVPVFAIESAHLIRCPYCVSSQNDMVVHGS